MICGSASSVLASTVLASTVLTSAVFSSVVLSSTTVALTSGAAVAFSVIPPLNCTINAIISANTGSAQLNRSQRPVFLIGSTGGVGSAVGIGSGVGGVSGSGGNSVTAATGGASGAALRVVIGCSTISAV